MKNKLNKEEQDKIKEEIRKKKEKIKQYLNAIPDDGVNVPYFSTEWVKNKLLKKPN